MDADFSIELGREDPVLDFPWKDPAGGCAYLDLKRHPELLPSIEEAVRFPELGDFLVALNSSCSRLETAKCDAWTTTDLNAEEEIYQATHKFACYVDAVFCDIDLRLSSPDQSLPLYEQFARNLVKLLRVGPEIPAAAEIYVRRCYFVEDSAVRAGCYFTLYVNGYGDGSDSARRNWGTGMEVVASSILHPSVGRRQ
jgi:hypothetical protein